MRHPAIPAAALFLLSGCLAPPATPVTADAGAGGDAGGPPVIRGLQIEGADGSSWSPERAPRRPVLVLRHDGELSDTSAAFLFTGAIDAALARDLRSSGLDRTRQARLVPTDALDTGRDVRLIPLAPLMAGLYTVGVGAWASDAFGRSLDGPFLSSFEVAREEAGAILVGAWPPDEAAGISPRLTLVALRFDDVVRAPDAIAMHAADGSSVDADVAEVPCVDLGWPSGACVSLALATRLAPETRYRVTVPASVLDRTGAAVGPISVSFQTGPRAAGEAADVPALTTLSCALDERAVDVGCVLADDDQITLRTRATGPVRAFLRSAQHTASMVAPRGEVTLALRHLGPDRQLDATLDLVAPSGALSRVPLTLMTTPPLAPVAITEVRADPNGAEPRQEYVEVLNSGPVPVELNGFSLSDRPDREGDVIHQGAQIPAGGRALLVADAFDPADPDDDPVPAGVPLVRIGTSLASGGLSNGGEPLFLRDPAGRRVSSVPSLPAPGPGVCLVRIGGARQATPQDFAADAGGGCTPGQPDRIGTPEAGAR